MKSDLPPAVKTEGLIVHFPLRKRSPFAKPGIVHAVDGVSLSVRRGTTFGIVGESGSGKTTTALAMMRLQDATGGRIRIDGEDVTRSEGAQRRGMRRKTQCILPATYS